MEILISRIKCSGGRVSEVGQETTAQLAEPGAPTSAGQTEANGTLAGEGVGGEGEAEAEAEVTGSSATEAVETDWAAVETDWAGQLTAPFWHRPLRRGRQFIQDLPTL